VVKENSGEGMWTEKGVWGIRTKGKLRELYETPDLAADIIRRRLELLGRVIIMDQTRVAKKTSESKPNESRKRVGRPILRWLEDTENDLREMEMKMWR
jgi:hypothetical protein